MQLPATHCARARASLSAQLDGELPEAELDRLETHLLICPACAAWAEQVRDVTRCLRGAALEEPAERFALPRLRRGWRISSAVAVASAAAVAATMFVAPGQHTSLGSRQSVQLGATGEHFTISRLTRLADGVYSPVSVNPSHVSFHHV